MADLDIPLFMRGTMSWVHSGYFFADQVPPDLDRLADQRTSYRFAQVLQRAQNGDFQALANLHPWLRHSLDEGWSRAAIDLFGDAGRRSELKLIGDLLDEGPEEMLIRASGAARMAGQLWLVPSMLRAWKRANDRDAHAMIGSDISRIMEPNGQRPIMDRRDTHPPNAELMRRFEQQLGRTVWHEESEADKPEGLGEAFDNLVSSRFGQLRSAYGDQICLWNGQPFDVLDLVREMKQLIRNLPVAPLRGLFIAMRRKLEATTGWNCSGCYRRGELDPLGATTVLEDIEDNLDPSAFEPGRRYYFGHPIPID
jgi:hypothetical protein